MPTFSSNDEDEDDLIVPVVNYVKTMENNLISNKDDEFNFEDEDESIISLSKLNSGGVFRLK